MNNIEIYGLALMASSALTLIALCIVGLFRNKLVHRCLQNEIESLDADGGKDFEKEIAVVYRLLANYGWMVNRFVIWDWEKLKAAALQRSKK